MYAHISTLVYATIQVHKHAHTCQLHTHMCATHAHTITHAHACAHAPPYMHACTLHACTLAHTHIHMLAHHLFSGSLEAELFTSQELGPQDTQPGYRT